MLSIPCLQTPRLILRPFAPADAPELHRIYHAEGVLRYFPVAGPPSLEKVERFVTRQAEHWEKHGYGNWAVQPKDADGLIGWAGLQYVSELQETEVGFLFDRPQWGKGFATEAALAALEFGFRQRELDRIIALVFAENLASRRVIAKCGMDYIDPVEIWGVSLLRYCKARPAV